MARRSLYEVLGVPEDSSDEDIKSAYRRLLRTVHPDVGGNAALFEFVQAAYETLSDPTRRATYDRSRGSAMPPPGSGQPPPRAGEPPEPSAPQSSPRPAPSRAGRMVATLLAVGLAVALGVVLASSGGEDPAVSEAAAKEDLKEPATTSPSPAPPLVVQSVAPVEPEPTGPSFVDVELGQMRAEFACTSALSRLPLDLNDPQLEPALRAAADAALSASLKDAKWMPLREQTRIALGAYIATAAPGDQSEAVTEFADAMFEIDSLCQAAS